MTKIIFKKMSLKDNIEIVKWAYYSSSKSLDIHKFTILLFPELASLDNTKLPKKEIDQIIEKVVKDNYDKYSNDTIERIKVYNKEWSNYNDTYFNTLSNYLNTSWPIKDITCYVGIIPVYPRDINSFSFAVSVKTPIDDFIRVCAHETLHFLWFTKWQIMYPNIPKKEYNSPYLSWQYSEMVTDPILNSKEIQSVFNNLFKEHTYNEFYYLEYNKENVMYHLNKIWQENISIEEKISLGYEYLKQINKNKRY